MKRNLLVAVAVLLPCLFAASPARADPSSALRMQTVDEVVERSDRAVQACGRGLGRHADTVAIVVTLTIESDGRVVEASAARRSREAGCLERVARRLTFPATGVTTRVAFPFLLNPR